MLYKFIQDNRELLLLRSAKLSEQGSRHSDPQTVALGHVSFFLDQLVDALLIEHGRPGETAQFLVKKTTVAPAVQLSNAAYDHGQEIRASNLTIGTLVRNYGSVCQAITGFAVEVNKSIAVAEFKTLNWCLDEAIAQAVIAFTAPTPQDAASLKAAQLMHDTRLDGMAKLSHHIERVANAMAAIRSGKVGVDGATGGLIDASLTTMRGLVEQGIEHRI